MKRVLIACEESQTICKAFRDKGFEAYSCDIQECSGGHPEWHIQCDILEHLEKDNQYDLLIAHPPCTFLSRAGARWLYQGGKINQQRYNQGLEALSFFKKMLNADIPRICVENPTPLKIFNLPKYSQVVQPFEYGHPYSKRTLLWLKNLPKLIPTEIVSDYTPYLPSNTGGKKRGQKWSRGISKNSKESSKTFFGIASAMVNQWGPLL
jgi:hypothetical protein